ncbi:MAG: hypothetical protein PHS52_02030 [Desulfotomaculaceae bacterium]|nr:hypothetical protein [Desulfotomaculaceae bacterium]
MKDKNRLPATDTNQRTGNSRTAPAQSTQKCDIHFEPADLTGNPGTPEDEYWDDDFICPACCCGIYIDLPEEKAIKLFKSIKR